MYLRRYVHIQTLQPDIPATLEYCQGTTFNTANSTSAMYTRNLQRKDLHRSGCLCREGFLAGNLKASQTKTLPYTLNPKLEGWGQTESIAVICHLLQAS